MVSTKPDMNTQIFTIQGMHCDGCASAIRTAICKERLYENCWATVVDPKNEIGELRITPKVGQILNIKEIRKSVEEAGYKLKR